MKLSFLHRKNNYSFSKKIIIHLFQIIIYCFFLENYFLKGFIYYCNNFPYVSKLFATNSRIERRKIKENCPEIILREETISKNEQNDFGN